MWLQSLSTRVQWNITLKFMIQISNFLPLFQHSTCRDCPKRKVSAQSVNVKFRGKRKKWPQVERSKQLAFLSRKVEWFLTLGRQAVPVIMKASIIRWFSLLPVISATRQCQPQHHDTSVGTFRTPKFLPRIICKISVLQLHDER